MADDENDRREYPYNYHRARFNINGRIMITAVVCLFVVVVLVVLLHIYARCILRRQARRRAALRQFVTGGATATTTTTQLHSLEPKRGLNQSVISSLPTFVYKQVDHQLGETEQIECSVCLSTLEDEEIARLLPNCKHTFHVECIDMWLTTHSTCPICRTEAEPRFQPETRDGLVVAVTATAPSVDLINSTTVQPCSEGTSDPAMQSAKLSGSSSRLSSFRRMLSRDRSSRRIQLSEQTDAVGDIERQ